MRKKASVNLNIRIRFSCLFSTALPTEYLHRVWDFFLCEGIIVDTSYFSMIPADINEY